MTEWKAKMYELSEKIIELAEKEGKLDQSNENVKSILSDIEALYANLEDEELRERLSPASPCKRSYCDEDIKTSDPMVVEFNEEKYKELPKEDQLLVIAMGQIQLVGHYMNNQATGEYFEMDRKLVARMKNITFN